MDCFVKLLKNKSVLQDLRPVEQNREQTMSFSLSCFNDVSDGLQKHIKSKARADTCVLKYSLLA